MQIAISALLTIVLAAGYTFALSFAQPEKLWDWFNTLVGSGLSLFIAVLGGIYLFRLQAKAEENIERKGLRVLLSAEFSDLVHILSDSSRMELTLPSKTKRSLLIAFVQPLVIERAALSSLFTQLESENLLHLARKIRMLNFKTEYLMGLLQSRSDEQYLLHAIDNMEQTRAASVVRCPSCCKTNGDCHQCQLS